MQLFIVAIILFSFSLLGLYSKYEYLCCRAEENKEIIFGKIEENQKLNLILHPNYETSVSI